MQDKSALGRAVAMVRDLRRRCPWDRVQTRETIRPYLVEEVMELDHAIAGNDPGEIREEVADLLLHLAWQLVLAEEAGEFTAEDVAADLERKMRRRHPHLFDLGPADQWENLKRRERPRGVLDGLPPALPSLLMAFRLQERAASVGFDWPDTAGPLAKVEEEVEEVREVLGTGQSGEPAGPAGSPGSSPPAPPVPLEDEIGDLLFAVVNLARKARIQPTTALDRANAKFRRRFESIERLAAARGIDVPSAGLEVLDRLWDEVKREEGAAAG
jgi:nucleoside triphosphate diphosphatase